MHMFLAGCLLSWAVIGIDPIRRRPGTGVKLTALAVVAAGHDTLARLIYAWNLPAGGGPTASRHTGTELMYYGGTVVEVALAAVVMAQWYLASGRALAGPGAGRRAWGHSCQSHYPVGAAAGLHCRSAT
jgi:putative membrane protein